VQTEELVVTEEAFETVEAQPEQTSAEQSAALEESVRELQRPIEALLFVASESLTIKQIAKLTHANEMEVAATLARIEADYGDRGIVLREVAGGYRFASAPLARDVVEAYLLPPKSSLSTPALETLAIVAYLQPVTKGEIEAIRGVASDSVVSTLTDKSLVAEAGRKDVVGRPMLYKTTSEFLESFGLRSLDDLPQMELEQGQPLELDLLTANLNAVREAAQQQAEKQQPDSDAPAEPDVESVESESESQPEESEALQTPAAPDDASIESVSEGDEPSIEEPLEDPRRESVESIEE
jgi:segregation and condensation protein B